MISGTVRGPEGATRVAGRVVEVVNVESGARQRGTTNASGAFSFTLQPGQYRVEIALLEGESIVKQPAAIYLNRNARADFVLGIVRVARPRSPVHQGDLGLGAPIA